MGHKTISKSETPSKREDAIEVLKQADHFIVISLFTEIRPDGSNLEVRTNVDDAFRDQMMLTVMRMDSLHKRSN